MAAYISLHLRGEEGGSCLRGADLWMSRYLRVGIGFPLGLSAGAELGVPTTAPKGPAGRTLFPEKFSSAPQNFNSTTRGPSGRLASVGTPRKARSADAILVIHAVSPAKLTSVREHPSERKRGHA